MYKLEENDIKTVSYICGLQKELAMIALQFARGNVGVAISYAKNDVHLLSKKDATF